MIVLELLRDGFKIRCIIVDVWFIEYWVWDGYNIIDDKLMEKLNVLREGFFLILEVIVNIYRYCYLLKKI